MNTILIGTDGSPSADSALDFAIELCRDTGAALTVLAVRPPVPAMRGGSVPILEVEEPGGVARIARQAAATAREAGIDAQDRTAHGDPADEIASTAREIGADLVVVGSRGLGTVGSVLMGSVSRALVKHAGLPVTIVKSDHDRQPALS